MSKIICDICGTIYPESSECCPICGSAHADSEQFTSMPELNVASAGESKKKKLFSDFLSEEFYDYEEAEEEKLLDDVPNTQSDHSVPPKSGTNWVLTVVLSLIIFVLLGITGYLFFRYYLPFRNAVPDQLEPTAETTLPPATEETGDPTVPCSSIVLTAGVPELTRIGQFWLLHTIVMPENTTDTLSFVSADENVVTVTAEGRLCAVGEGETTVVISCGKEEILCQVVVKLPSEDGEQEPEMDNNEQNPQGQEQEITSEPSATNDATALKLKQSDISFTNTKKGVTYQLELDCDLTPEEVEWYTMDPNIALCHNGLITIIGQGTTRIGAKYQDQEVLCIVRITLQ